MIIVFLFVLFVIITTSIAIWLIIKCRMPEAFMLFIPIFVLFMVTYHIFVSPRAQCLNQSLRNDIELTEFCTKIVQNEILLLERNNK